METRGLSAMKHNGVKLTGIMEAWSMVHGKLFQLKSVHVFLNCIFLLKENCSSSNENYNSSHRLPDAELIGKDSSEVFFIHSDIEPVNSSVSF